MTSTRLKQQKQLSRPRVESREFKLQDICRQLGVDYDGARYALAQRILPAGIDPEPGRGRHRVFTQVQAFYLATALKLKEAGLSLPRIRDIIPWTQTIHELSCKSYVTWKTASVTVRLQTHYHGFLDFGDGRFVRIRPDSISGKSQMEATPWVEMSSRREAPAARPSIVVAIDMGEIARLLDSAGTASHPAAS